MQVVTNYLEFLIALTKYSISFVQSLSMEHNSVTKIPLGIFSHAPELTSVNLNVNQIATLPLGKLNLVVVAVYVYLYTVHILCIDIRDYVTGIGNIMTSSTDCLLFPIPVT